MAIVRILHVIAPGPIAGAEKSVVTSVAALADSGYQVALAVVEERRDPHFAHDFVRLACGRGILCITLEANGRFDPRLALKLGRMIREEAFEVVHAHGYKALTHLCAVRWCIPSLVVTYHGATSHTRAVRFYEGIERLLFGCADRVFAVSEAAKSLLEQRSWLASRVVVVPNSVSVRLDRSQDSRPAPPPLVLLYMGRLSHEKGPDVLVDAISELPADSSVVVRILGDGPEREALAIQVQAKGLGDRVAFLGFQLDVVPHIAQAHALVMPSRTEGLPMALLEAAGAGLPVVASRVGGIPEVVSQGRNGLLVEPNQSSALAAAILSLELDYAGFRARSEASASEIVRAFSAENWVHAAVAHYRDVGGG